MCQPGLAPCPTDSATSPGFLAPFPEGKVERVFLGLADIDASAAQEVVDVPMRELAVRGGATDRKIDVLAFGRVDGVRVPLGEQRLDEPYDIVAVRRSARLARLHVGREQAQRAHVVVDEAWPCAPRGLKRDCSPLTLAAARILSSTSVTFLTNVTSEAAERASVAPGCRTPCSRRRGLPGVRDVVGRGAADVEARLARNEGLERLELAAHRVVEGDRRFGHGPAIYRRLLEPSRAMPRAKSRGEPMAPRTVPLVLAP